MAKVSRRAALAVLSALLAGLLPATLVAAPTRYQLDASASTVEFTFSMGGVLQKGTMPVSKATILVDPTNLTRSRVDISVDVGGARTPLPFARQALIGKEVLDASRYPTIRFVSTAVTLAPDGRLSGGATITGKLTVHGVTKPVTFKAGLFRAPGSAPDDLSNLTVKLTGQINRTDFGASGFGDLVADTVGLNITGVISTDK